MYICIYIIYIPNLGLEIAVSVAKGEQDCFRGNSEGAKGSIEGALEGVKERSTREPELVAS